MAKDRATKEGLVVNPPSEDNLPGQDQVTYASEVQDVLIPYTTKEDTYNYYEVRNCVNDVNREHTQVLQTYDDQLKPRETYTYGKGRSSYHNHSDKQTYNYLTNQSGTVTGLTRAGNAVASSSYNLYGSSKASTDTTGNPFAYNGEARDVTGLDFLRARYYDSHAGTFLTEDSYPGSLTDPLSQNRYAYVQNNPVNYTDPSGHRAVMMERYVSSVDTKKQRYYSQFQILPSDFSPSLNGGGQSLKDYTENLIRTNPNYRAPDSYYQTFGLKQVPQVVKDLFKKATATVKSAFEVAKAAGLSTHNWDKSTVREAKSIEQNWTKALEQFLKHVCNSEATKATDSTNGSSATGESLELVAINQMTMSQLQKTYGGVISSYNTFIGTGYFQPQATPINKAVLARYKDLKAEEEAKVAAKFAEADKYYYLNIYKTIQETGLRPDGTTATDLEKKIAPYVVRYGNVFEVGKNIAAIYSAYVGYQSYYGKPILGVDTSWLGKPKLGLQVVFGSDAKNLSKLKRQMEKRGWTKETVIETVDNPYTTRRSKNLATNNSATAYYDKSGNYVIIDDITKEVVQISERGNMDWLPDKNIINPYKPRR